MTSPHAVRTPHAGDGAAAGAGRRCAGDRPLPRCAVGRERPGAPDAWTATAATCRASRAGATGAAAAWPAPIARRCSTTSPGARTQDYSPRSNARLLSALRAFFAWCVRRGSRGDDPTALLQPPKLPRSLPKALAESEIEALLAAPEVDTPLGLRDRAMLELMYACGLRVSELVNLPATARQPAPGRAAGDGQGQQGAAGAAGRGGAALAGALPGAGPAAAGRPARGWRRCSSARPARRRAASSSGNW